MYRSSTSFHARHQQRVLGGLLLWLFAGSALVLTTLVPAYSALLGWTPAFWAVAAPLIMLLVLDPGLPRALQVRWLSTRRTCRATYWN